MTPMVDGTATDRSFGELVAERDRAVIAIRRAVDGARWAS